MNVFGPAASGGGGMFTLVFIIIAGAVLLWLFLMPSFRSKASEHLEQVAVYVRPERQSEAQALAESELPVVEPAEVSVGQVASQLGFDMSEFTSRFGGAAAALEAAPDSAEPAVEAPTQT